jgi:dienelactone hydrolase
MLLRWRLLPLLLLFAATARAESGPWNVDGLLGADTPLEVQVSPGAVEPAYYPSEPYRGKPTRVFAYYGVPDAKKFGPGPYPAMLLVHGGGGKAFAEWAQLWVDRGYVALAMDLAGHGPDGKPLPDGGPNQDDTAKFTAIETGDIKDTWPYQAVAAVIRGHAALTARPEVDARRIGITGISWGGYLTSIVAGIDHRLAVAVPVYGCGFLGDNSAWLDTFAKMSREGREKWLATFDPSRYVAGIQCPTLFVNGTNDFAYPLDSYRKIYQLVTAPRMLCVTVNMPHSHPAGWAPQEIGAYVDSILKQQPPLADLGALIITGNEAQTTVDGSATIAKAELHFTTESGRWQERKWTSQPAQYDRATGTITAQLPQTRPLAAFITVQDDRGLIVSTEHVELAK